MQKFHCDSRTKCRNASGSLTSGSPAGCLRASAPNRLVGSTAGTSSGESDAPVRPGAPRSKMGGSRNWIPCGCGAVRVLSWG